MATKDRGFASMNRGLQKKIASMGGKAAHAKGTAHKWNSITASEAGRKGGLNSHSARKRRLESAEETESQVGS